MAIRKGQHVISRSTYQARGFLLAPGEALPDCADEFSPAGHAPRLIQITKGDRLAAEMIGSRGDIFVRVERDGRTFACALLPDSFEPT